MALSQGVTPGPVIEVYGLHKTYGQLEAVRGIAMKFCVVLR